MPPPLMEHNDTGSGSKGQIRIAAAIQPEEVPIPSESRFLYDTVRRLAQRFDPGRTRPEVTIPECPVFRPTEEEFRAGPIEYIGKIVNVGERFGIVKIIPPNQFQDRQAIRIPGAMRFTCRMQRINEHDAFTRCQLRFREAVQAFWRLQAIQMDCLYRDGNDSSTETVSLYKLMKTVQSFGGYEHCADRWTEVAAKMNIDPVNGAEQLQQYYRLYLHPFETFRENMDKPPPPPQESQVPKPIQEKIEENTNQLTEKRLRKRRKLSPSDDRHQQNGATNNDQQKDKCPVCQKTCSLRLRPSSRSVPCSRCSRWFHKRCVVPPELEPKMSMVSWHCDRCLPDAFRWVRFRYGDAFSFKQSTEPVTLEEFKRFSDEYQQTYFDGSIQKEDLVEREFWRIMQDPESLIYVQYGADITSKRDNNWWRKNTATDDPMDPWILANLAKSRGSIFEHYHDDIDGVTAPWLYAGMIFSIFCWHNEDHYLNSINYLHEGQAKTWYGIPGPEAERFERAIKTVIAPELFRQTPDLVHHLVTHCDPCLLQKLGVPVYRTDQHAGEFVVTFPQAYHAGFNQGFNIAEAVNFAGPHWIEYGRKAVADYRFSRPSTFSHDKLIFEVARYYRKLSQDMLQAIRDDLSRALKQEETTGRDDQPFSMREMVESMSDKSDHEDDDNFRQCHQCKHQLYYSAAKCHCGGGAAKYFCIDHIPDRCRMHGRIADGNHVILTLKNLKLLPLLIEKIDAEILLR